MNDFPQGVPHGSCIAHHPNLPGAFIVSPPDAPAYVLMKDGKTVDLKPFTEAPADPEFMRNHFYVAGRHDG